MDCPERLKGGQTGRISFLGFTEELAQFWREADEDEHAQHPESTGGEAEEEVTHRKAGL
jgi:hypothetical protein